MWPWMRAGSRGGLDASIDDQPSRTQGSSMRVEEAVVTTGRSIRPKQVTGVSGAAGYRRVTVESSGGVRGGLRFRWRLMGVDQGRGLHGAAQIAEVVRGGVADGRW